MRIFNKGETLNIDGHIVKLSEAFILVLFGSVKLIAKDVKMNCTLTLGEIIGEEPFILHPRNNALDQIIGLEFSE